MNRAGKIVVVLLAVGAAGVHGQEARVRAARPLRPGMGGGFEMMQPVLMVRRSAGVEHLLRQREELKLSDGQASQLEAIRKEQVARRQEQSRERIDLESRAAAGLIEPSAMRKQLEERDDQLREESEKTRDQVDKILTDAQRDQLREGRGEALMEGRAREIELRARGMELRARGMAESLRGRGRMELIPGARFRQFEGRLHSLPPRQVPRDEVRLYRRRGPI